jgi:hypothetical protein
MQQCLKYGSFIERSRKIKRCFNFFCKTTEFLIFGHQTEFLVIKPGFVFESEFTKKLRSCFNEYLDPKHR